MEKRFRFLEDLAMADYAFEAFGSTIEELFENSALALESVIVDLGEIRPRETSEVSLSTSEVEELAGLENLLFDFLSELVYLQSAEGLVFADFEVAIEEAEVSTGKPAGKVLFSVILNLFQNLAEGLRLILNRVQDDAAPKQVLYSLRARCSGERIDPERHTLGTEVKGVTMHRFEIEGLDGKWRAQVVLDV